MDVADTREEKRLPFVPFETFLLQNNYHTALVSAFVIDFSFGARDLSSGPPGGIIDELAMAIDIDEVEPTTTSTGVREPSTVA